jgi:hypothetical protein
MLQHKMAKEVARIGREKENPCFLNTTETPGVHYCIMKKFGDLLLIAHFRDEVKGRCLSPQVAVVDFQGGEHTFPQSIHKALIAAASWGAVKIPGLSCGDTSTVKCCGKPCAKNAVFYNLLQVNGLRAARMARFPGVIHIEAKKRIRRRRRGALLGPTPLSFPLRPPSRITLSYHHWIPACCTSR